MPMKRMLSTLFFLLITLSAIHAQTVQWGGAGKMNKADTIKKKIVDRAEYVVTYQYKFAPDAAAPQEKKEGMTVLQLGNQYNRFCDFYELAYDSLYDDSARKNRLMNDAFTVLMPLLKKKMFTESLIFDKQKENTTIQRTAGLLQKYQYQEKNIALPWKLLEGDTIIAGYACKKAQTALFGRTYTAWYTPEINLPYGPYKFHGLPGLVVHVVDTQNNFVFTLNGFQKVSRYVPIYYRSDDVIKTSRSNVRKIYKNFCADPVGALTSGGNITIPKETAATVKARPYNPMELE